MIDILMATYNGEKYLAEQLESIINQTYTDWHLYIQDDVSSDSTAEIAREYAQRYPNKITLIVRDTPSGGAKENFLSMLPLAKSDYIMFSDQDDVWLPEKIEITHSKMLDCEHKYGKDTPLLVHTDLRVVDEELNTIAESHFKREHFLDKQNCLCNSLLSCKVSGSTSEINRSLLDGLKFNNSQKIHMHDIWAALYAMAFGKLITIKTPTILYRQHSSNVFGLDDDYSTLHAVKRILIPSMNTVGKTYIKNINITLECFYENYYNELSEKDRKALGELVDSFDKNKAAKVFAVVKNRLGAPSARGYIYYLVFC